MISFVLDRSFYVCSMLRYGYAPLIINAPSGALILMRHLTEQAPIKSDDLFADYSTLTNFLYYVSEHNSVLADDALSCIALQSFTLNQSDWIDYCRKFINTKVPSIIIRAYLHSPEVYL